MRVLRVVGRSDTTIMPRVSTAISSKSVRARWPSASPPTAPTKATVAPSARRLFATLPAPPSVNEWLFTLTTGTGASGEIRLTRPQIHSSIITSPMTTTRRPAMRASNSLAVGAAMTSSPTAHDPLGRFQQRLRAKIGLGPVVRDRPGNEHAGDPKPLPERDIAGAVADDRTARDIDVVLARGAANHPRFGLAAVAAGTEMRTEVKRVDLRVAGLQLGGYFGIDVVYHGLIEIAARNAGLIADDDARVTGVGERAQRRNNRRQHPHVLARAHEPHIIDQRP